jgi:septal ring factor EnvC (AmiA/AmiB activator)
MAAKIFSGLTILIALAAIFFGFKTKELVEKLQATAKMDHEELLEKRATLKRTQQKLKETEEVLATTQADLATAKDKLAMTEAELAKTKTELADTLQKKADVEAQYAAIKESFEKFKAALGEKTPEELLKDLNDLVQGKKDLTAKVAALENDVASQKIVIEDLSKQQKKAEGKIADQTTHLNRYIQNIMIKGTRGQVLAVNAGWGFCVVSLGDKRGAAANKILIVTRGGQAIGKVRIINVEASQSVADIIPSSFARGVYVQPGDEVIYTGDDRVREEPSPADSNAPRNSAPNAPSAPPAGVPGLGDLPAR